MKILVTGATGWLGSRLVEMLNNKNMDVKCLIFPLEDQKNLKDIKLNAYFGDLTDRETLNGLCKNVNIVIHCAGIIHPQRVRDFYKINVLGTKNILEESFLNKVEKFIFISSNSVAGININNKFLLEEDKSNPYKNYGISKKMAEDLVNQYFKEEKLKTVILRPCWFYGIRQPDRQTRFFRMIKRGNPFIFGKGDNLRSMSYIDNVISAIINIIDHNCFNGKTYWIADERPYKTIEIYETIANLLDVKNFKPIFLHSFVSDLCEVADNIIQSCGFYMKEIHVAGEMNKNIACSINKAKKDFNYAPEISLREGMQRSIKWCRENGIEI